MPSPLHLIYDVLDARTRRRLPLLFASFGAVAAFDAFGIGLVFPLMLALADPQAIERSAWLRPLARVLHIENIAAFVPVMAVAIGVFFALKNLVGAALVRWQYLIVARAEADMGVRLLERYLHCPWPAMAQRNSSQLIREASASVGSVCLDVIVPGIAMCVEVFLSTAILAVLVVLDPLVALVSLALIAVTGGAYLVFVRRTLVWVGQKFQEARFGLLNSLKQGVLAGREIRVLGRSNAFIAHLAAVRAVYAQAEAKNQFLAFLPRNYLETMLVVVMLVAIGLATTTRSGAEVVPLLAVFGLAAVRLMISANRALASFQVARIGLPALYAVHADLCGPLETLPEAPLATPHPGETGIVLDQVTFAYRDALPAVAAASLAITWGESIGIVGPSGSGKSTLIDLIVGLLAPQQGSVRIDGQDQRAVMASWRARIGYVPQHIYLTDDTLRRNVAFGLEETEIDEARVQVAVRLAQLDATIASLPDGLATVLGEQGATLSGGQCQRVGLARALYHDPDVLILDEATSALDNETERIVVETVEGLRGAKTVFVVAHRLTTVQHCDRIVLMSEGRIRAVGSFADLARDNLDFARLVHLGRLSEASDEPHAAE